MRAVRLGTVEKSLVIFKGILRIDARARYKKAPTPRPENGNENDLDLDVRGR
jgi:hypothetical protein